MTGHRPKGLTTVQQSIVENLRLGPLQRQSAPRTCGSARGFKTQINALRQLGYIIECTEAKRGPKGYPGTYILHREPSDLLE